MDLLREVFFRDELLLHRASRLFDDPKWGMSDDTLLTLVKHWMTSIPWG